tara:strand:+ start:6810 stop:8111 length:1302 start_codon:yes stop_codon:yes gene_type:complete
MFTNYQKIFEKKFLIFLIFTIFFLYIYQFFNYNISKQHDVWLHHYYILNILKFNFSEITSEYGIFYYFYTACFSLITYPLYYFQILEEREVFYLTVRLSNLSLLTITFFIIYKICRDIFNFKYKQITLTILLCFSFAFFNKTFFMARPENLMIPVSLIIILETYKIINNKKITLKIILPSLCILSAQKVSGLIFSLVILAFLFFKQREKNYYKLILFFTCGLILLYLFHYLISGVKFYQNSDRLFGDATSLGIIHNFDKFNVLYKFSLIDAWKNPLRDFQNYSLINILSLELIGDYWKYGVFNNIKFNLNESCLIILNRISIIYFIIFLILIISLIIHFFNLEKKFSKSENSITLMMFILMFAGIGVIILAVFFRANFDDLDIVKYEYISYFIIPIIFVIVKFSAETPKYNILIYTLIGLGLYNNLLPIHCLT